MPVEKINAEQEFIGKMERVMGFSRSLFNMTFGEGYEGGRNRMAKVVVFSVGFTRFIETIKSFPDPMSNIHHAIGIKFLNVLIDVFNSTDDYWDAFWKGEHPEFKPQNYNIIQLVDGKEITEKITDVTKITITE